jgi:large subunit ribosomal protein L22
MKSTLKHNRQAPRKVRLVADMVRGKGVKEALALLRHTPKKATDSLEKVLKSAVANAKENEGKSEDNLYIETITVDKGFTMKRRRPQSRGMSHPIRKHTSIVSIILGERAAKKERVKKEKKAQVKTAPSSKAKKSAVKKAVKKK